MALSLITVNIPPPHLAIADPEQWNNDWEKLIRQCPHLFIPKAYLDGSVQRSRITKENESEKFEAWSYFTVSLCGLQRELGADAVHYLNELDLENKWLTASQNTRRKHLLRGLSSVCSIAVNLNESRACCVQELRLTSLANNGQLLLDLLAQLAPEDVSAISTTPSFVPHLEWDALQKSQEQSPEIEKLILVHILVLRTKLITHVLHFTIRSFLGRDLPKIWVAKNQKTVKTPSHKQFVEWEKQALKMQLGSEDYKTMRGEHKDAYLERKQAKRDMCQRCHRPAKDDEKFQKCSACASYGRIHLYCSRECQIGDWKDKERPHKLICGKDINFEVAKKLATPPSRVTQTGQIGPPAKGFKRSLALLNQIQILRTHPTADYVVVRSIYEADEKYGAMFYEDGPIFFFKDKFRARREKAMSTGDRVSVVVMLEFILWHIFVHRHGVKDFRKEVVIDQLSKEYCFPELEQALAEYDSRRALHPQGLPHLVHSS